jgi:tetratricopeptide (TPR) repeat protein
MSVNDMDNTRMPHRSALETALQHLQQRLEAEPHNPQTYMERGMTYFKMGYIAAAIADFDRAEQLNPALTPYLWQRGLAYYYAERFEEGAIQFETDLMVHGQDVEETVWRYLCQARVQGPSAAREALLPVRHDPRPVMAWVYRLFTGACEAETVLAQHQGGGRRERFYCHLYVGLYYEAEQAEDRARLLITQAAEMQVLDDYMGWLAIVHRRLRGW